MQNIYFSCVLFTNLNFKVCETIMLHEWTCHWGSFEFDLVSICRFFCSQIEIFACSCNSILLWEWEFYHCQYHRPLYHEKVIRFCCQHTSDNCMLMVNLLLFMQDLPEDFLHKIWCCVVCRVTCLYLEAQDNVTSPEISNCWFIWAWSWCFSLKWEHRLRVLEKKLLMRMSGPRKRKK